MPTPDRVQLNVEVDRKDRDKLHELAPLEERTAAGVVRLLIKDWIAQRENAGAAA
jgi:hypothetical protein